MAQQRTAAEPVAQDWSRCVWPLLPPELAERIVGKLDRYDILVSFRRVNKATARHFSGPHTRVRLSKPVPPHAFAAHWLAPGATRDLNLERRRQLVRLVAASGVQANLEMALQAAGFVEAATEALKSAAGAGNLPMCQWLQDYSRSCGDGEFVQRNDHVAWRAAAGGGHRHVCNWLFLLTDCQPDEDAVPAAARAGHVGLAHELYRSILSVTVDDKYLSGVAHGCDLAALQRVLQRFFGQPPYRLHAYHGLLADAAGSPTPDWAAKVEYLEAYGLLHSAQAVEAAAALPNDGEALARLTWLRGRGYPLEPDALSAAARSGNTAALQYLLAEAPADVVRSVQQWAAYDGAMGGHLAVLQALRAAGWPVHRHLAVAATGAARGGHLHVLAWLLSEQWPEAPHPPLLQKPGLFALAAGSGSVELLAWLREHGCPLDGDAFPAAVKAGCEAALEWLVGQGCPIEVDDDAPPASLPLLRGLLEAGCPVDLGALQRSVAGWRGRVWPLRDHEVLGLVLEHTFAAEADS
ncbi:hypothetical protein GPECTOR_7g948 [Gonium pectorale]|uniref:F-box domain-containing protein n=1 Tax=Gonium pectorale TaxID=33097 RepID=A0A150GUX8_GONPE|nr:hypothetical protein GPECTOR_7g948 [Gonium pectorale]|eukprot:KXZ53498.1 hypothetical protein GPECTOR_7g948 [Gonium pectorale]